MLLLIYVNVLLLFIFLVFNGGSELFISINNLEMNKVMICEVDGGFFIEKYEYDR